MVCSLFPSKTFNQPKTLALDRISSSMLHSCLEHLLVTHFVLPVTDVWQFDPWWIPKLGDQPTLGLSPKFLLLSSPLNRFGSCGVRQSIQFIFSDKTNFVLRQSLIQSDFVAHVYWLDVSISVRMRIQERKQVRQ